MDYSVSQIEQTVNALYKAPYSATPDVHEFLRTVQLSPQAWRYPWELLCHDKSQEVQLFAVSTLHVKIASFWNELNPEQLLELRMRLIEKLFTYTRGPRIILTKLCITLSCYIIRTIATTWTSAVSDIIQTLQAHNIPTLDPKQVLIVLLEILTVIPEEFETMHLPSNQRGLIRNTLKTSLQPVFSIIQDVIFKYPLGTGEPLVLEVSTMALKCFASWSQLDIVVLEYDSLLSGVISLTSENQLCQSALEALGNVVNHCESNKFPTSILNLLQKLVIAMEPLLEKALREQDMDICCSAYNLIVSTGETHSKLLIDTALAPQNPEHRDTVMKLIQLIMKCSGTPGQFPTEEICSDQAFGFWYIFQDDIVASSPEKFQQCLLMFHSVFLALVDTYLVKVRYPLDEEYAQWSSEEKESFRCYRQDIGDSFMYCYSVLRESMLASLMSHLQIASNTASSNLSNWQYLEACIYGFHSVAENLGDSDNRYLQQFFTVLPTIPLQHVKVISSMMETIGAYAEWINTHPQVLAQVIPLLLMGLRNSEVSQAATMALKDISRDCQPSMKPFAEDILKICLEVLTSNHLKDRDQIRLMCTVGQVLSVMPIDYIMSYLNTALTPMVQNLHHILEMQSSDTAVATTCVYLNMFTILFSTLDIRVSEDKEDEVEAGSRETIPGKDSAPQPVFFVLQKLMPVYLAIGLKWNFQEDLMALVSESLKRAIGTLQEQCHPLVPEILQFLSQCYSTKPQNTSCLEVSKMIILLFGKDEMLRPQIDAFFSQLVSHTLNLFKNDLSGHTAVAESFFLLMSQITKRTCSMFDGCANLLPVLFQCAIASLGLPEKSTVKTSSSFITEFINQSRDAPLMLDIVNAQGEELVGQILKVIGGSSPRLVVEHMPDILMALNKKYFDNLCRWMTVYIQRDGFPSSKINAEQKESFTRLILRERTNKRKLKELVTEFSLLCRGLFGSQYAAETFSQSL